MINGAAFWSARHEIPVDLHRWVGRPRPLQQRLAQDGISTQGDTDFGDVPRELYLFAFPQCTVVSECGVVVALRQLIADAGSLKHLKMMRVTWQCK